MKQLALIYLPAFWILVFAIGCINGNFNSYGSGGSGCFGCGVNLEVPIEMIDYGVQSNTSAISFNRSSTSLDTNDYDGFTSYYFEILGSNNHASNPYQVMLIDGSSNVMATITVPANTLAPVRYRVAFGPNSGADVYRIKTALTAAAGNLKVQAARLLVQQVGASRTRIYIPLTGMIYNSTSSVDSSIAAIFNTTVTTDTVLPVTVNGIWQKNNANFSGITSWGFDAVISTNNVAGPAYAAVYNQNLVSAVGASTVSTTSTIPQLVSMPFPDNAANFSNFHNYGVSIRATATYTAYIYKSGIWVRLSYPSYGEVYYRLAQSVNSVNNKIDTGRVIYDASAFSNPSAYFEAAATQGASGPIALYDTTNNDSGVVGSDVVGSLMSPTSPGFLRFGPLALSSGNRYIVNSQSVSPNWLNPSLVVKFQR